MTIENKKTFLLESSRLYETMIRLTTSEVIRRYLAFRIIVNAMAFEDLVGNRSHARFRQIRNVLLAHKQEDDFFEGYKVTEEITDATISPLISYMAAATPSPDPAYSAAELVPGKVHNSFSQLLSLVFEQYHADFLGGFRLINNHLCYTGSSVHEVSDGDLPGIFYRYHSSMALFQLAQYIYNNSFVNSDLLWTSRNAKLDMLLHAQNLADSLFKDLHNKNSIDGLLEVMSSQKLGNVTVFEQLKTDPSFVALYSATRKLRNKLVGHMDKQAPLNDLIVKLDAFAVDGIYNLVNKIDQAVFSASQTHPAVKLRYISGNQPINDPLIVDISGLKPGSYF
ncbi:MAG: hypothetical protein NTZ64_14845 [Polaromonas sp.]|nr:hypothetical protein [Polaromonas sp.]